MNLGEEKKKVDALLAEYHHHVRLAREERDRLKSYREVLHWIGEAQCIVQQVAQRVQAAAHERIAGIVTRCLRTVFPEDGYDFKIHFERKAGRTEARMVFLKGGMETDPLEEDSGGVVDVAAFALRVAALLVGRPTRRKLLILDEPFKGVRGAVLPRLKVLVETLAEETGIQFVIVSIQDQMNVGKVIELG